MDTTNIAKEANNKIAFIKNNEVIDCLIVSKDADQTFLDQLLIHTNADSFIILDEINNWVGVSCHYINNQFVGPKPSKSWIWDGTDWTAPVPKPEGNYIWNEAVQEWVQPSIQAE